MVEGDNQMAEKYVCYYRVSTTDQGKSGLGLDAQRKTVEDYLNGNGSKIVGEYTEVESGGKDDRPELQKAITDCKLKGARLVVAKLDRLSRDLHFITELQKAGVRFVIAEMPDATELTIHIYAALAQHERKLISQRTKDALAELKKKGVKLGSPILKRGERIPGSGLHTDRARAVCIEKADTHARDMLPIIKEMKRQGATSLREIASMLNESGYTTPRGKAWQATSVNRILKRASIQTR
jgi:DNA invertase Pin-like site-specific DNA recombinase